MAQSVAGGSQKALSQTKEALLKSYQKRLKDDIKSMVENYVEIIKLGKVYRCMLWQISPVSIHILPVMLFSVRTPH